MRHKLSPEALESLHHAEAEFVATFGRKPGRHDRIFIGYFRFGEDELGRELESAADESGIRRELIYAFRKTGRILTEQTLKLVTKAERAEWVEAIDEYRSALEDGVDLLDSPDDSVRDAMNAARKHIDNAVIHFGSYADRAPPRTRKKLPLFLQFLLISQCHRHMRALADGLLGRIGDEAFALLRSIYECALLIAQLELDNGYADALVAQALVGTDLYQFRSKKDGTHDYSRIVSNDGKEYPGRNSFTQLANGLGDAHAPFFDALYPLLSKQIHFDTLSSLQKFQGSGEFLSFDEPDYPAMHATALLVICYAATVAGHVTDAPKIVKQDALFLRAEALALLDSLNHALADEGARLLPVYCELEQCLLSLD